MTSTTSTTSTTIFIALAQLNLTVGAVAANAQAIIQAMRDAAAQGADVLLTPELAISGYPPEDLLYRPAFAAQVAAAVATVQTESSLHPDLFVVLGHPAWVKDGQAEHCYNAASVLHGGKVVGTYYKRELPNYAVFDEKRYFTAGTESLVFEVKGRRFGINICEDVWFKPAPKDALAAGAQALLVLNASPFHHGKVPQRMAVVRDNVSSLGLPYIGVNHVGGQDELVFDGASFVLNAAGECTTRLPQFEPALAMITLHNGVPQATTVTPELSLEAEVYASLVLATRDYIHKNGFKAALLGLSGGVDSALVLAVGVDAIGSGNMRAVMMPTRFTAGMSLTDSRAMIARLGVQYEELPIEGLFENYLSALAEDFKGTPSGIAEENLQARIRGTLLMALSNKFGSIVLTTGNKSETAVGYCTLYGDMCGGFAVLKDVPKTLVYRLCAWRNAQAVAAGQAPVIPENILTRAPSAELRDNQTDQDSLPEYDVLDAIIDAHLERNLSLAEIVALNIEGADETTVRRVLRLIQVNEYKRRQSAVGPRITTRAFGRDWRLPITSGFEG
jgi:NAD+ synthase (glutamine-hydrolysing)